MRSFLKTTSLVQLQLAWGGVLAALALINAAEAEGIEPSPRTNPYSAFIQKQASQLHPLDAKPPANPLEGRAKRDAATRAGLLKAWGPFPEQPCALEAKVLGTIDRDGYRIEKIIFQTMPGVWMTANAYVPDAPGKHPAILNVHGHWKGAKQDPGVHNRCIAQAKLGFFALVVDAFGAGERGVGKALGEYHGALTGATLLPVGMPLSGIQVYENRRALDYLETRPEVDPSKIGITGASGGGNQSLYAGATDDRIKAIVPICSIGNYHAYLKAACCMCEVVPGALQFAETSDVLGLAAPRALLIGSATKDAPQFSVAAARHTVEPLTRLYAALDAPGRFRHDLFESGHDYNQEMREATYGWMALHLKGEGDGKPITEPGLKTEEPEALRCYPGDSRPDDWLTLPRFAAREGRKVLEARPIPSTAEKWKREAETRRKALVENVLGGFPKVPEVGPMAIGDGAFISILFDTEPGLTLSASTVRTEDAKAPFALVLDLDRPRRVSAKEDKASQELSNAISQAGWRKVNVELRATGSQAVPNDLVHGTPDHNSAEWGLWIGRPLLGQWVFDVRRTLDALEKINKGLPDEIILIGKGGGGIVALATGATDPRVTRVAALDSLASYITEEPYKGQRLGIMAPGILREVGDVAHLAALNAPRRVVIAGGVAGNGTPLSTQALNETYQPARQAVGLLNAEDQLKVIESSKPDLIIKALKQAR